MPDDVAKKLTASESFPAPVIPLSPRTRALQSGSSFAPPIDQGMMFRDIGSSGLRQYSGWVREEFLPQLAGREAARVYREMQDNSSTIGALMFAINATIRKIEWRVESADDTPEGKYQAEFIEGCMDDMSHTWNDFVVESMSMLGYGFAPHEIVYKKSLGRRPATDAVTGRTHPRSQFEDERIRWRRLPLRGQDTILKWFFGPAGEIEGLTQQPWVGPIVDIPIEKLLLFRSSVHKGNPEGRSILRSGYRSYYLSKRFEELEAIMFERMGGIPVIYLPQELIDEAANGNGNAVQKLEAFKRIVTNVRIDEQMGLVLPSDMWSTATGNGATGMYRFELVVPAGRTQAVDSEKAIQRYNLNMLSAVLADFIQLGHESRGTQSLAMTKTDMFFQAAEGFLIANADVLNRHGIPRLMDINGFDANSNPELKPDMPQRTDLDVLSNFLLRLQQAGMPLFPNDTLQEFVLDAAGMPDVTDDDNYEILSQMANDKLQAATDSAVQSAENLKNPPEPAPGSPKSNFQKMIGGAIARRLMKMNGATATTKRKHRRF